MTMLKSELCSYILDQLSALPGIRCIPMMGGYVFYINDRVFGGIYETGFLVKDTPSARRFMPDSVPEEPYMKMLPVTILDDNEKLCAMVSAMESELPEKKPKKKKA